MVFFGYCDEASRAQIPDALAKELGRSTPDAKKKMARIGTVREALRDPRGDGHATLGLLTDEEVVIEVTQDLR